MRPKLLKLVHCAPVEMNCSPVASHFVGKANNYMYHKYYKHSNKSLIFLLWDRFILKVPYFLGWLFFLALMEKQLLN